MCYIRTVTILRSAPETVMVHVLCTRLYSAIEVERSRELYADLRSILVLLEMEQSQECRAEKNKNLHLPDTRNFNRFLREGTMYLGMANNFNNWAMPNNTKNEILRKTLNVLGRVRFQYKRMLHMRNELLKGTVIDIREDISIAMDDMIEETDALKFDNADVYDLDEFELIGFYDWQSYRKIRTTLLKMIDSLIDKIYCVIVKRYLMLYSILKKYCRRATKFLHSNKKILKLSKLRRRQGQNSCCKYHFLKQLIACCYRILLPNLMK